MANKQVNLAKKLIRIAHKNPERAAELKPKIHRLLGGDAPKAASKLSEREARDLAEVVSLLNGSITAAKPEQFLTEMPGFSPMQLRAHINRLGSLRQEIEMMQADLEESLKKLKGLEGEEKEGQEAIKAAAKAMQANGNYVAEAESALIKFSAKLQPKRPGIEQMIARPEDSKWGDKAGDFFGRVAAKLGAEVATAVETIYEAVKEDLTHKAIAVSTIKVIQKTSSLDAATLKTAGIVDSVLAVKDWLAGKARGIFNFVGDIGRWVRGFLERSKLIKKKSEDLQKALDSADKQIDKLLAGAI